MSRPLSTLGNQPEADILDRVVEERFVYIVEDGQDLVDEDLVFSLVEINRNMCEQIPSRIWHDKTAQKCSLAHRYRQAEPSALIQERAVLKTL